MFTNFVAMKKLNSHIIVLFFQFSASAKTMTAEYYSLYV